MAIAIILPLLALPSDFALMWTPGWVGSFLGLGNRSLKWETGGCFFFEGRLSFCRRLGKASNGKPSVCGFCGVPLMAPVRISRMTSGVRIKSESLSRKRRSNSQTCLIATSRQRVLENAFYEVCSKDGLDNWLVSKAHTQNVVISL